LIAIRYHDATKHHFGRFSPSLGYLDWATQPDPFRRYTGAPLYALPRSVSAPPVPYSALYDQSVAAAPVSHESVGEFLRCAMGLSAWKAYRQSRWALRVNPSSGNLHPTEAWLIRDGQVLHYAPAEHALERRCDLGPRAADVAGLHPAGFLVALTSITWREAWKYGERAFRYCQHDVGHALGALRLSAAMLGWRFHLLPGWSDRQIAALLGLDRDAEFDDAEPEEPECIAVVVPAGDVSGSAAAWPQAQDLADAAVRGEWYGRPNRLSARHVTWPLLKEVVGATRHAGGEGLPARSHDRPAESRAQVSGEAGRLARDVILQRRSALGFASGGGLRKDAFLAMLDRLHPGASPWDAIDWTPEVHLVLFVHRVHGVTPGVYAYLRDRSVRQVWQQAMRSDFLWEPVEAAADRMFLLLPTDVTRVAERLSCDQAIAGMVFSASACWRGSRTRSPRAESPSIDGSSGSAD
jgi:SagB-type dehydrogenase family enzyme